MFKAQGLSDGKQACGPVVPKTSNPSALHPSVSFVKGCCCIPKANTNSSNRIKATIVAAPVKDLSLRGRAKKNRRRKVNKKRYKLSARFFSCPPVPDDIRLWSEKQLLDEYCLVIDGSAEGNRTCFRPESSKKEWRCCSIREGHLFVPDLPPPQFGLVHPNQISSSPKALVTPQFGLVYPHPSTSPPSAPPPYRLLPREDALKSTHLFGSTSRVNKLCSALDAFEKAQRKSLKRGMPIFGDHKYTCAGTQPCRASAGVRDTYHMAKVDDAHVETVVSYVRNLEHLLEAFAESEVFANGSGGS